MNDLNLPVSVNATNSNSAVVNQLQAMVCSQSGIFCSQTNNRFFLRDGQAVPVWNPKKKLNQRFLFCWFFKAYVAAFADERLIIKKEGMENIHFSELTEKDHPHRFEELGYISGSYQQIASRYPGLGIARESTPSLNGEKEYQHKKLQVQDIIELLQKPALSSDVEPSFYAEVPEKDAELKAWNPLEKAWVYLKCFEFPLGPTLHDWESMAKQRSVHTVALARLYQDKVQEIFSHLEGRVFYGHADELDFSIAETDKQLIPEGSEEPTVRMVCPNFLTGAPRPRYPIDPADSESLIGATASEIVQFAGVSGLPTDFTWPKKVQSSSPVPKSNPTIAEMVTPR